MNAADRELIRMTSQIYIERFRKWPEGDTGAMIKDSAMAARWIMEETYESDQAVKIANAERELESANTLIDKLQIYREDCEFALRNRDKIAPYRIDSVLERSNDIPRRF